ncbi:MAG: hypothetical protein BGN87_18845 [Rhizobiales bacterium 65-79]|jgi:hypothetical protein|nr:hypothetical protein [Hyphomicrobiales bacterium]OJU02972.1 MAG: hypothetical protein BGN87_18845 [Rhizobiales bacterium 65-79]
MYRLILKSNAGSSGIELAVSGSGAETSRPEARDPRAAHEQASFQPATITTPPQSCVEIEMVPTGEAAIIARHAEQVTGHDGCLCQP